MASFAIEDLTVKDGKDLFVRRSQYDASATRLVGAQDLASTVTLFVGIDVQGECVFSNPRLRDRDLRDQVGTIVGVFYQSTVTCVVIPCNGRATRSEQVFLQRGDLSGLCEDPVFMRVLHIRVVVVMSNDQGGMCRPIEGAGRFVTLLCRIFQINVTVMPDARSRVLQFRQYVAFNVHRYSPCADLFTGTLCVTSVVINRDARLLCCVFFLV